MNFEQRIKRLEDKVSHCPGTSLTRILSNAKGFEWSLGIGKMQMPKEFFTGKTIFDALNKAEKYYKIKL